MEKHTRMQAMLVHLFFLAWVKLCQTLRSFVAKVRNVAILRFYCHILAFCDYLCRFMVLFSTFMALYSTFWHFGLLHCFVENSLLLQFMHFFD